MYNILYNMYGIGVTALILYFSGDVGLGVREGLG